MKRLIIALLYIGVFSLKSHGINVPSIHENYEILARFSTNSFSLPVENPNRMFKPQLSGVGWEMRGNWRFAATAITSNWVVTTYHAQPLPGNVIKFLDVRGKIVEREIDYGIRPPQLRLKNTSGRLAFASQADVFLTKLKEPLPPTVVPILLPNSFPTNSQKIFLYGFTQVGQNFAIVPSGIKEIFWSGGFMVSYLPPFYPNLIVGDSNSPVFTERGEFLGVATYGGNPSKHSGVITTIYYPEMKKWIESVTGPLPYNFELEMVDDIVLFNNQPVPIENIENTLPKIEELAKKRNSLWNRVMGKFRTTR